MSSAQLACEVAPPSAPPAAAQPPAPSVLDQWDDATIPGTESEGGEADDGAPPMFNLFGLGAAAVPVQHQQQDSHPVAAPSQQAQEAAAHGAHGGTGIAEGRGSAQDVSEDAGGEMLEDGSSGPPQFVLFPPAAPQQQQQQQTLPVQQQHSSCPRDSGVGDDDGDEQGDDEDSQMPPPFVLLPPLLQPRSAASPQQQQPAAAHHDHTHHQAGSPQPQLGSHHHHSHSHNHLQQQPQQQPQQQHLQQQQVGGGSQQDEGDEDDADDDEDQDSQAPPEFVLLPTAATTPAPAHARSMPAIQDHHQHQHDHPHKHLHPQQQQQQQQHLEQQQQLQHACTAPQPHVHTPGPALQLQPAQLQGQHADCEDSEGGECGATQGTQGPPSFELLLGRRPVALPPPPRPPQASAPAQQASCAQPPLPGHHHQQQQQQHQQLLQQQHQHHHQLTPSQQSGLHSQDLSCPTASTPLPRPAVGSTRRPPRHTPTDADGTLEHQPRSVPHRRTPALKSIFGSGTPSQEACKLQAGSTAETDPATTRRFPLSARNDVGGGADDGDDEEDDFRSFLQSSRKAKPVAAPAAATVAASSPSTVCIGSSCEAMSGKQQQQQQQQQQRAQEGSGAAGAATSRGGPANPAVSSGWASGSNLQHTIRSFFTKPRAHTQQQQQQQGGAQEQSLPQQQQQQQLRQQQQQQQCHEAQGEVGATQPVSSAACLAQDLGEQELEDWQDACDGRGSLANGGGCSGGEDASVIHPSSAYAEQGVGAQDTEQQQQQKQQQQQCGAQEQQQQQQQQQQQEGQYVGRRKRAQVGSARKRVLEDRSEEGEGGGPQTTPCLSGDCEVEGIEEPGLKGTTTAAAAAAAAAGETAHQGQQQQQQLSCSGKSLKGLLRRTHVLAPMPSKGNAHTLRAQVQGLGQHPPHESHSLQHPLNNHDQHHHHQQQQQLMPIQQQEQPCSPAPPHVDGEEQHTELPQPRILSSVLRLTKSNPGATPHTRATTSTPSANAHSPAAATPAAAHLHAHTAAHTPGAHAPASAPSHMHAAAHSHAASARGVSDASDSCHTPMPGHSTQPASCTQGTPPTQLVPSQHQHHRHHHHHLQQHQQQQQRRPLPPSLSQQGHTQAERGSVHTQPHHSHPPPSTATTHATHAQPNGGSRPASQRLARQPSPILAADRPSSRAPSLAALLTPSMASRTPPAANGTPAQEAAPPYRPQQTPHASTQAGPLRQLPHSLQQQTAPGISSSAPCTSLPRSSAPSAGKVGGGGALNSISDLGNGRRAKRAASAAATPDPGCVSHSKTPRTAYKVHHDTSGRPTVEIMDSDSDEDAGGGNTGNTGNTGSGHRTGGAAAASTAAVLHAPLSRSGNNKNDDDDDVEMCVVLGSSAGAPERGREGGAGVSTTLHAGGAGPSAGAAGRMGRAQQGATVPGSAAQKSARQMPAGRAMLLNPQQQQQQQQQGHGSGWQEGLTAADDGEAESDGVGGDDCEDCEGIDDEDYVPPEGWGEEEGVAEQGQGEEGCWDLEEGCVDDGQQQTGGDQGQPTQRQGGVLEQLGLNQPHAMPYPDAWWNLLDDFVPIEALKFNKDPRNGAPIHILYSQQFSAGAAAAHQALVGRAPGPLPGPSIPSGEWMDHAGGGGRGAASRGRSSSARGRGSRGGGRSSGGRSGGGRGGFLKFKKWGFKKKGRGRGGFRRGRGRG